MTDYKGIAVLGELAGNGINAITTELLGCARRLADQLGEPVSCILAGEQFGDAANECVKFGADRVFTVADPALKDYENEAYLQVMEKIVADSAPRLILMGQTSVGRDLAPSLAFKLAAGLSTDCLDIKLNADKKFELTRSVYGGNAQAIFCSDIMPQIATVRSKAMSPIAADAGRKGETVAVKVAFDAARIKTRVVQTVKEETAGIKLEDATVIVSGGRGIANTDGFKQLEILAKLLKGAVGATRPPCDNGWWPETQQVGLTGKVVSPDVYIAVAISGASQHMAGCSGAKNIIAINKDAEANIFKFARFGVVGDWKQIVPAMTEEVKKLLAS
jgi:electron transfer flavoprotein alpha subunit